MPNQLCIHLIYIYISSCAITYEIYRRGKRLGGTDESGAEVMGRGCFISTT